MIATDRLLEVLVESADTLVEDFDLIDFLHQLADNTAAVSEAASVGLLLGDEHRQLQFMAASTDGARHLELFALQNAEGPCLDCFTTRAPVIVSDLSTATDRWPVFAPRALELGMRSVHAFPLRLREQTIGALNVFGDAPLPLAPNEIAMIQSLADIATIAVIQERAVTAAETLTTQLQSALNSRIVIEQTKGAVAQSLGVTTDEAFALVRSYARSHQLRLSELCRDIVTRRFDVHTLRSRPRG